MGDSGGYDGRHWRKPWATLAEIAPQTRRTPPFCHFPYAKSLPSIPYLSLGEAGEGDGEAGCRLPLALPRPDKPKAKRAETKHHHAATTTPADADESSCQTYSSRCQERSSEHGSADERRLSLLMWRRQEVNHDPRGIFRLPNDGLEHRPCLLCGYTCTSRCTTRPIKQRSISQGMIST